MWQVAPQCARTVGWIFKIALKKRLTALRCGEDLDFLFFPPHFPGFACPSIDGCPRGTMTEAAEPDDNIGEHL
jgi:hypothetical protein